VLYIARSRNKAVMAAAFEVEEVPMDGVEEKPLTVPQELAALKHEETVQIPGVAPEVE
jgi:hypothetical protein